jgi:hypothetical protein
MGIDLTNGEAGFPYSGDTKWTLIDSGNITLTAACSSAGAVVEALPVPAGFLCYGACLQVVTAATTATGGTTFTVIVGDNADTGGYDATTVSLLSTGRTVTQAADSYGLSPVLYTADNTIDLTVAATAPGSVATLPVVRVKAYGIKLY